MLGGGGGGVKGYLLRYIHYRAEAQFSDRLELTLVLLGPYLHVLKQVSERVNPLNPQDVSKHHFASLKNDFMS